MNYFGLFFTFMLPGVIIGMLLMMSIVSAAPRKRRVRRSHRHM